MLSWHFPWIRPCSARPLAHYRSTLTNASIWAENIYISAFHLCTTIPLYVARWPFHLCSAVLHGGKQSTVGPLSGLCSNCASACSIICLAWWQYEAFLLSDSVSRSFSIRLQLIDTLKKLMRPYSVEFKSPLELSAQGECTPYKSWRVETIHNVILIFFHRLSRIFVLYVRHQQMPPLQHPPHPTLPQTHTHVHANIHMVFALIWCWQLQQCSGWMLIVDINQFL